MRLIEVAGQTSRASYFEYTAKAPGRIIIQVNSYLNNFMVEAPPAPPPPLPSATVPAVNEAPAQAEEVPLANNWAVILGVCGGGIVIAAALYYTWWRKRNKAGS